jgi:class 3 adenylate cyclase
VRRSTHKWCGRSSRNFDAARVGLQRARRAESSSPEALEGERKTVTALFADIKSSTELMRDLDPEEASGLSGGLGAR